MAIKITLALLRNTAYVLALILFVVGCAALYVSWTEPDHAPNSIYIDCPDVIPSEANPIIKPLMACIVLMVAIGYLGGCSLSLRDKHGDYSTYVKCPDPP